MLQLWTQPSNERLPHAALLCGGLARGRGGGGSRSSRGGGGVELLEQLHVAEGQGHFAHAVRAYRLPHQLLATRARARIRVPIITMIIDR